MAASFASMKKYLIFNADDFGASTGVNRGIVEAHRLGVVTSASLMVTGSAVREAVSMSSDCPALDVGLHWDVCGEDDRSFAFDDAGAVREEFRRQIGEFEDLLGRPPTHIDSHQHAHRRVMPLFRELVAPLGVPLRGDGRVTYLMGFYAQWKWKVTELDHVSVPSLQKLIRVEVLPGISEIGCHPGYVTDDYRAVYLAEREAELETLTDPRIAETIREEGIELVGFADYARIAGESR
jgi:predicted glycoside hydrolase/deacetylase ChbG (UPF0249 family)